jgi:transcriptional regulator
MYDLPYHKATNESVLREFIRQHPFAFVTGCDAQGQPVATQLPVFFEERDGRQFLSGHLMKNTDHHKAFEVNPNVLAVFASPHVYVSGSWYSDPHTPSTWNYMSVHVRGVIRFLGGSDLERVLRKTSLHFEGYDERSPTTFDNLPASLTERLVHAIAAFEVEVKSLDSVFKLSQDRDDESYHRIIERLRQNGDAGRFIASEMERRAGDLFPDEKED